MINASEPYGDITFSARIQSDGEQASVTFVSTDHRPIAAQIVETIDQQPELFWKDTHRGVNKAVVNGVGGIRMRLWGNRWEMTSPSYLKFGRKDSKQITEALARWSVWCCRSRHDHKEQHDD